MTALTSDRIISAWVYNPEHNLFGDKGGKAARYRITCQNPEGCDIFTKQNSCLLSGISSCKFGRKTKIDGPTKRSRSFQSWMADQKKDNADYLGKIDSLKAWNRVALINGYYYLPYLHMDGGWFASDRSPIKTKWVLENDLDSSLLQRLCTYVPYGFGGPIPSYQKEVVPKFIADLCMFYPILFGMLTDEQKERTINVIGRQADLTTCLPGKYTFGAKTWDWDGSALTGCEMLFQPAPGACKVIITPEKGSPVKITSNDQVGTQTLFLD